MPISHTTPFWIVDKQHIFCQNGMPFVIYFNQLKQLANIDVNNIVHLIDGGCVLSLEDAQILGIDLNQGEFIAYRHLIGSLDDNLVYKLSQAIQLLNFHKTHQFCGTCGQKTIKNPAENSRICSQCQYHVYPKIQPCIIVAITRLHPATQKLQILLAKHHRHADIYTLIAGFVEAGETLEMAAVREVYEEVGLNIDMPIYFGSQPWPYPTNLMVGFTAKYQSGNITLQQDELSDAQFFDIDALPKLPPTGTIARKMIDQISLTH